MKKLLKIAVSIFTYFVVSNVYAVDFFIPDENFRLFLQENYSSVINEDGTGDSLQAHQITGAMVMSDRNIIDISGIEYFDGINELYLNNNSIVDLSPVVSLKQLQLLNVSGNQIEELPSFLGFTQLESLIVYDNQIKSLPSFEELTALRSLVAFNNSIDQIPDFGTDNILEILDLGGNSINTLPDLSYLIHLKELALWALNISSTPDLSSLTDLEILNLGSNNLSSSPDLSSLLKLKELYLDRNYLRDIPDGIKDIPSLEVVHLEDNEFSLNDLMEIKEVNNYEAIFTLVPQKYFPLQGVYNKVVGDSIKLKTSNDASVEGVYYQLFKNNELLQTNETGIFKFDSLRKEFAGAYYIKILTTAFPEIYRRSNLIDVQVEDCVDLQDFELTLSHHDCKERGELVVNYDGTESLEYTLLSDGLTVSNNSGEFLDLYPGYYAVDGLIGTCSFTIFSDVQIKNMSCDEIQLTPDNDGVDDYLTLEYEGTIRVLDKNGVLQGELEGPIEWEGIINGTSRLPIGVYFLEFEGSERYRIISLVY